MKNKYKGYIMIVWFDKYGYYHGRFCSQITKELI
jgi:hypothetical protein